MQENFHITDSSFGSFYERNQNPGELFMAPHAFQFKIHNAGVH
jgi:hypothetical protein